MILLDFSLILNQKIYKCPDVCTIGHKMGQIEKMFYNYPVKKFHIREIARLTSVPKSTVANKVKELIERGIVLEDRDVFKAYRANENKSKYRYEKAVAAIKEIIQSEIVDFLNNRLAPKCIILFGSIAKGEYNKNSDIDFYIQCKEEEINLKKYENILKREVQLFMKEDPKDLPKEMLNNIINGNILSGFLKLF